MCCKTGNQSKIVHAPNNTLVIPSEGGNAYLKCESDAVDEIAWTYDGNTVIVTPCQEVIPGGDVVFASYPKTTPSKECNVNASLEKAQKDLNIRTISGPYGCTDQSNAGVTETAMVIVLGKFHNISFFHFLACTKDLALSVIFYLRSLKIY